MKRSFVGPWLFGTAGLTLGMVAVGGMTRLTESGLSITEWKPVTGAIPPLSQEAWQSEFDKYRNSPEFTRLRAERGMSLDEFKRIFYWEWGHRAMGRLIGVAFGVPWLYFVAKGQLRGPLMWQTGGLLALGGVQGAIGWWMVKSGLENEGVVSHHRLTIHLGSALVIYSSLIWLGLNVVTKGKALETIVPNKAPSQLLLYVPGPLVFATALTGAQVAGLDAGLIYNETFVIPSEEREHDYSARKQWHHRVMGVTTTLALISIYAICRRQAILPRRTMRFAFGMAGMAVLQATLGVTTLVTLVKKEWASLHQICSVLLLTSSLHFSHDIRRILRAATRGRV